MYFKKIDIKLDGRLTVLFDESGRPIYPNYHETANTMFKEWGHQRFIYLGFKTIRRGEFTLYAASQENEDVVPYAEHFIHRLNGKIKTILITESDRDIFVEAMPYARAMGYLRNGKEICEQLGI